MKLLLVEDDRALASALTEALQREGFVVDCSSTGKQALASIASFMPALVVLDLGLPDMDGMQVLTQLRRQNSNVPVLILTARDALDDKVKALDLGADDYLAKPFDIPELMARLRVLARRLGTAASSRVCIHDVCLDLSTHTVTRDHQPLVFSRREFMVLKALMENTGRVQTKNGLEEKLYGWGEEVASNTIEVHISHIRKKLPSGFIQTIRGVGYIIRSDRVES